ncbi:hypothetical protein H8356DRAFT_1326466 [Neocallimastix lanati (nom. inval.)]|nr:hypothetical protein H8356DRAFT_1326466 [Neocallimastix sp. JGI-2020a]
MNGKSRGCPSFLQTTIGGNDSCLLHIPLNILYCPLRSFLSLQVLIKLMSVIAFYEDHN